MASEFWSQCLDELKTEFSPELFHTWFADLTVDDSVLSDDQLKIFASSAAKLSALKTAYSQKLSEIVNRIAGRHIALTWCVSQTPAVSLPVAPASENVDKPLSPSAQIKSGLLPDLTFENFVQGKANQMAFAAALQVANSSGKPIYNPLIIYGGVGLGKTHLMHAIGHQFLKNNPARRVLCISAQQYLEEFTGVMRLMNADPKHCATLKTVIRISICF